MLSAGHIKRLAASLGFDLCGVAPARPFASEGAFLRSWIADGKASGLGYMERNVDKRADVRLLVEGACSVAVCAVSYKNAVSEGYAPGAGGKVASYACCADYHDTMRRMLDDLLAALRSEHPTLAGRSFVDTAPLLEKRYAVEAGLGWIGRQSLLVTPHCGTFVLLGELVLCEPCDTYDSPLHGTGCGSCRRCVDACPNGAICGRHIDTGRCISRATVERGGGDIPLHGWIFGCDECQSCCPYNRSAPLHTSPLFDPLFDPRTISEAEWEAMSEDEFRRRFGRTPLMRSGSERIKQNLLSGNRANG